MYIQNECVVCEHCLPSRQSTKRAYSYSIFGSSPANVFKSCRHRAVAVQQVVWHHEGERSRNRKVRYKADEQRGNDADRDGSLGIFDLFTWDVDGEQTQLKGEKNRKEENSGFIQICICIPIRISKCN